MNAAEDISAVLNLAVFTTGGRQDLSRQQIDQGRLQMGGAEIKGHRRNRNRELR